MLYGRGSQSYKAKTVEPEVQEVSKPMLSLPDQVIELLEDGAPHSLVEISRAAKISDRQAAKVLDFLDRYGFASLKKREKTAQIEPEFLDLLRELP